MGKSTGPIQEEFAILRLLLIQTAKDADRCLKALERNLGKYDRRHGLHFRSTSKHFMRNDIRVVKDVTMDLRHVAKRINRSKYPTKSEVNAARISMNAAADAMNDLKHAGRVFDQNNGMSGGVTGIIDNILSHNDNDSEGNGGLFGNNDDKTLEPKRKGGFFSNTKTFLQTPDTLEEVVRLTLRDNFGGVSPLKHQISATESALSPSFAARAKEAVVDVAHKFIGDTSPSPTSNDGRTYSL